jgi:ribose transport system substrate-binding protein
MKLSRLVLAFFVFLLLGMLPACSQGPKKIRVGIVTNNPEDFWKICDAGARKAAKDFDVEVIFRMPDNGEVGEQRQIVRSLVEQGVSGVAVSVIDPKEQSPDLKQVAAQVKLITMDNDADGSDRICYVGTDNYAAGREVGRLVKEALPNGGDVAIFVGQITPVNARLRFQGVVDELAGGGQKNVEGTAVKRKIGDKEIYFRQFGLFFLYNGEAITDGADRTKARQNAIEALGYLGDRENVCMIGLWAYNPPQILKALTAKTFNKVRVVGFDEDEETLRAIEDGRMHATVVQDPFNFGYKSVEIMAAEARGDTSKRNIKPIPYRVVTKNGGPTQARDGVEIANLKAADFAKQLKALLESVK